MAKVVKNGDIVNGYRITELLNKGAMANAYAAISPKREKVFFKQYKSPSICVEWYDSYVSYQKELKSRVESSPFAHFTYRMLEFFEADYGPRTFFQVFEFVRGGLDMEKVLTKMRESPGAVPWEQRLILSKIMMNAIAAMHKAGIVHCDLKPANIQLFPDASIGAGYHLKIIDMDFSILADKQAPWHGSAPYVGSPHYFSPEHITGKAPTPESDVFTCGLILFELLGQGHPHWTDDDAEYSRRALSGAVQPFKLSGPIPPPAKGSQVGECICRCLSPDASRRPTAKDVNLSCLQ